MAERTLSIIKPDATKKNVVGPIIARFEEEGLRIAALRKIHMSKREWERKLGDVNWSENIHQYAPGESHGIPYRCLTPRGLHNLLVAGRCISTDRAVQGSTR